MVIGVVLPVRVDNAVEMHVNNSNCYEHKRECSVNDVLNRLVTLFQVCCLDVLEFTLAVHLVTNLSPGCFLLNLLKNIVESKTIHEKGAEHETVEEKLPLEICVIEEHENEGDG